MSTTRHLINRRRRLESLTSAASPVREQPPRDTDVARRPKPDPRPRPRAAPQVPQRPDPAREARDATGRRRRRVPLPAVLGVVTVLLGGFGVWAGDEARALREDASVRNTALTDTARTSKLKGEISRSVGALFSYDHADAARTEKAAQKLLTGKAVEQHRKMLAGVREKGPGQKSVLTTTVTGSGVELLDGDRARVLVYADQRHTRTSGKGGKDEAAGPTYAPAMFAVDTVFRDGVWKITRIDTFGRGRS
ncbi:hypothetical protein [Streptomyces daliensis]|uniref:Nuclear transport factor 2 family protein n=1 Tax=Streptomyces daliensis TaxID=299421 RepID=A0A8T4ISK1_9ACTN|nr:nuclear transport factor 2 family protein [Streptomyces daliensis]